MKSEISKAIVLFGLIGIAIFFFMLKSMGLSFGGVSGVAKTLFYGIIFIVGFFVIMKYVFRG